MQIKLQRIASRPDHTLGVIVLPEITLFTLELPWRNNAHDVSCIPSGIYPLGLTQSEATGPCLSVGEVPGRTEILMHGGFDTSNTHGCVLVGEEMDTVYHDPRISGCRQAIDRLRDIVTREPGSHLLVFNPQ